MRAIFYTDNPHWCARAPMGWTYVLVNESGLIKFGKSIASLKVRARQIYGYPDFSFIMAFADAGLEAKLHNHFDKERCCYIPLDNHLFPEVSDYKTKEEADNAMLLKPDIRYRKTRKELFKLTNSGSLSSYLIQELNKLGYFPVKMESPDDVLPFESENTQKVMAGLVSKIAEEKLKVSTLDDD
ncbi:hypothetical protein A140_16870 [Vibrio crassostreae 9ZC88]|nr:hypothetical protein A140_16870 [Vibrio crassostreae 9ZC88]